MKKSLTLILILMSAILFSSCGDKSPRELKVVSHYFPGLTTMKAQTADYLTEEYLKDRAWVGEGEKSPNYSIAVRLSRVCGTDKPQLEVYNSLASEEVEIVKSYAGRNGYFVGARYYEHAEGISFCPYPDGSGYPESVYQHVLDGRCVAFLKPSNAKDSDHSCYAVTDYNRWFSAQETAIWCLTFPEKLDSPPTAEKVAVVENTGYAGNAVIAEDGTIYITANRKLFAVNRNWEVQQINTPEYWENMPFNSMVYLNGSLYLGAGFGIMEYVITNDEFVWYPIDELEYSPYWE